MRQMKQIMQDNPVVTIYSGNPARTVQTLTSIPTTQQRPQPTTTSSPSTKSTDEQKRIEWLFLRFAAIYGHLWKSLYKTESCLEFCKQEWMDSLRKYNNQTIRDALLLCREQCAMPPTIPEFIECCKTIVNRHQPSRIHQDFKPGNQAIAEDNLKKIRQILNLKSR